MNWKRTTVVWVLPLLLGVIAYAVFQIAVPEKRTTVYTVSVIVEESSANRWYSFREGINQYADSGNVVVNYVSTSSFSQLSDLTEMITREQTNGADGIIVYPGLDDQTDTLSGLLSSIPSVLVGTGLSGQELIDVVEPDGYEMGEAIAALLMEHAQLDENTGIGVLSGNQRTLHMQNCLRGFSDALSAYENQIRWTLSQQVLESGNLLGVSMEAKNVDILVALDNTAMENAIDFLTENPKYNCLLFGEGRSEKCIYYLDRGMIGALAVPDEFMMGYESMLLLMQKMSQYSPAVRSRQIQIFSVTGDNLYDEETAGFLFPTIG